MHFKTILRIIGLLMMVFSFTLLPPIVVGLIYQDGAIFAFVEALVISFVAGLALWAPHRHNKDALRSREGYLIVVLFWIALVSVGFLPFYLTPEVPISFVDALFESMSGLTTTGATVLTGLDSLPHAILFYRQMLQWLGGMGIIVLAVAVLPMLGIGGMQLYKAEMTGVAKDAKMTPRVTETAKRLWQVYVFFTALCALLYWWAGMDWFDAIGHAFSTLAIGGFSTHDASLGYFDSVIIEVIAMAFMFIAGVNFALHFSAIRNWSLRPFFVDIEFRFYASVIVLSILVSSGYLWFGDVYGEWVEALRYGAFHTVSFATTTGFASTDFSHWPAFVPAFLIMLSFIGGSSGSTGGGMKVVRVVLLFKQGLREIKRLIYPNAIIPVKIDQHSVSEKVSSAIWGFLALYLVSFVFIMLLLMFLDLDQVTAYSATAATINNLGPGLGEVLTNFQSLSDAAKSVLIFSMLLGRLEIFTLLVLLTRAYWRS